MLALLLGGWMFWQISTTALATLAVRSADPRLLAVTASPTHPKAGSILAEALLARGAKTKAANIARSVVLADPTNDRAMRVLGIATEQLGEGTAGAAIMYQAGGLGWRDTPTQLWIVHDAALRNDAVTVIQRTDALARRNRSTDLTRAVFLAALDEPRLRAALVDSLGKQPVWRPAFFADVDQRLPAKSIPGMEALFREMQMRRQPIMQSEWLSYINRLVDLGEYSHARTTWAKVFAIPAARLSTTPYDPDFTLAAAQSNRLAKDTQSSDIQRGPFEWTLNSDLAGTVTFAGNERVSTLSIPVELTSSARGSTAIISQLLTLPPGTHLLTTHVDGNATAAAAEWTIACLPSNQSLPRHLPRGTDDTLSAVSFDVPATGCGAQRLTLATRDRLEAQAVSVGHIRIR
jgi:hypothetical protein